MRAFVAVLLTLGFVAGSAGAAGTTSLRIRYWPEGKAGPSSLWTLRCAPAAGTHPRPAKACDALEAAKTPFAPIPKDVGCTQVYGGPQVARVSGTFHGRGVWAVFQRRDGCEISRWSRVGALLPAPSGPS